MDFYWKNDIEENTFENFKRGDGFSLTADNKGTNQNASLMVIKDDQNNLKYSLVDFSKRDYGWNGAVAAINNIRSRLGLPLYTFSYVMKGERLTASIFNEAREAITPILPYIEQHEKGLDLTYGFQYLDFPVTTPKHMGEIINADYFNQIAEVLSIEKLTSPSITELTLSSHMPTVADISKWGNDKISGKSFPYIILGRYSCIYSDLGADLISLDEAVSSVNGYNYVDSDQANHMVDVFLNIIPHPKYGAIFLITMNTLNRSLSIGWFAVPPETLQSGTFGVSTYTDSGRDTFSTDYYIKDFSGVNWIVHNEVAGLHVVFNNDMEYFPSAPSFKCYGDVTYVTANENADVSLRFDYPVLPFARFGRYGGYIFPPHEYNGNLYILGKDNILHKYNPSQNTWIAACGGQKFDIEGTIGAVKYSFVYDHYIYIWPNIDFGKKLQWMGSYWLVVGYNEPYLYRIDLNGSNSSIEKISTTFVDICNDMKGMDIVMQSSVRPEIVYSTCYDGTTKFYITDLRNMTCNVGYAYEKYEDGDPYYVEHWEQNWAQNEELQDCEFFSGMDMIAKENSFMYYFDYYDQFKRYDLDGFTSYTEIVNVDGQTITKIYKLVDGAKVYISEDEERPLRVKMQQPPEVCGCPKFINDQIYAISLESIGTRLYRFSIGRNKWELVGEMPLHY